MKGKKINQLHVPNESEAKYTLLNFYFINFWFVIIMLILILILFFFFSIHIRSCRLFWTAHEHEHTFFLDW